MVLVDSSEVAGASFSLCDQQLKVPEKQLLAATVEKVAERHLVVEERGSENPLPPKGSVSLPLERENNSSVAGKISAASVATVAVGAGTTAALSGAGAWLVEKIIGLSLYIYYAPSNPITQYVLAQYTASCASSILSLGVVATVANVALGIIVTLGIILSAVAIYNLFIAEGPEERICLFQSIANAVSSLYFKIFS